MLDFWKTARFRHGFPTDFWRRSSVTVCEAHILPWQSQCRSTHQRRSRHLEQATRCSHAWPLQNLSLRLISLARFRLIPSVSEGYIPRIPPRSSTRRTITKKKHHWVFQSRSRMKNPEAAAASQQLARYWRCLVLVQATALGNHSETVFLRQVCFFNWRGPGGLESRSVSTIDESLMTSKRDWGESVGRSMRDRENLHKILEGKAESSIQGGNEAQKNYQRLKLMWKLEGGSKEVQKLLYMNPIENLKLKDYSFFRRIYGTMLKAKELVCVENWKWRTSSSKKVAQKIAKKLKNCEGVAVKRVTELDKQNEMNCPWCNRGILKQWVNSWLRWESHRIKRIPCLMRENFMILKLRAALERPTLPVHP